ncbi:hypothetical protein EZS27_020653 [termite gut metagenome]|uniref:Uncharacterized protein n=1 Tax=termite gut metagenome TaxID=433724 RepID=A0A5J4RC40_9ZZZZ
MKQTKLVLFLVISAFMVACGEDDEAPLSLKEQIIGKWELYPPVAGNKKSLDFSATTLTYTTEEGKQFLFPYTFTTQNNNINVSYSTVLYFYENDELWGPYAPDLTKLPDGTTAVPDATAVYSVPGWTFVDRIGSYNIYGYAVNYINTGVITKEFFASFSNWKIVNIKTTGEEDETITTMELETARVSKTGGAARLATETYTFAEPEE